jgi:hypothetical protein
MAVAQRSVITFGFLICELQVHKRAACARSVSSCFCDLRRIKVDKHECITNTQMNKERLQCRGLAALGSPDETPR